MRPLTRCWPTLEVRGATAPRTGQLGDASPARAGAGPLRGPSSTSAPLAYFLTMRTALIQELNWRGRRAARRPATAASHGGSCEFVGPETTSDLPMHSAPLRTTDRTVDGPSLRSHGAASSSPIWRALTRRALGTGDDHRPSISDISAGAGRSSAAAAVRARNGWRGARERREGQLHGHAEPRARTPLTPVLAAISALLGRQDLPRGFGPSASW